MNWKNGGSELDTSLYSETLECLLDIAIEFCVENSLTRMTNFVLIRPIFALEESDTALRELTDSGREIWARLRGILRRSLREGITLTLCAKAFADSSERGGHDIDPYDRSYWRDDCAAIIDLLDGESTVIEMLSEVLGGFAQGGSFESELFGDLVDIQQLLSILERSSGGAIRLENLESDGEIDTEAFTLRARLTVDRTLEAAAETGHETVLPIQILYALLENKDGYTMSIVRTMLPYSESSASLCSKLRAMFSKGPGVTSARLDLRRGNFNETAYEILNGAARYAGELGDDKVGDRHLLIALMRHRDQGIQSVISNLLGVNPADVIKRAEDTPELEILPVMLPMELCDCANLSLLAPRPLVPREELVESIVKALYRRDCHNVAIYGERGVGITSVGWLLANALRSGFAPTMQLTPVIYMDLNSIPEESLETRIGQIFNYMDENPGNIYVLEGFTLFLTAGFGTCMRRLANNAYKLVAIVNGDGKMMIESHENANEIVRFIEVAEPKKDQVLKMIEVAVPGIEAEYGVTFDRGLESLALRLSGDYILSQRFPKKAINLLRNAAGEAAAEFAMHGGERPVISRNDLAGQVANITGLPMETVLGLGQDKDYVYLLSQTLVGQDHAIGKVADRLDLIEKGFVDKRRPAAIFLFAGLSGTGKTELAKQIAAVYSSSHKIITYPMASFTEPQTVSGIVGSAPGLVGYDEGGKLINDINRDPYSLILFDEVEKADPTIWDPFLNLFDEGVITDMRGVSAYANKAFFVLTSNIGQYEIVRMLREGKSLPEIEDTVKNLVGEERHFRTHEKCFRPEFIGRIMRSGGIVIFNALSREAMEGITRSMANRTVADYAEMRELKLEIDDEVISEIARRAYEENEGVFRNGEGQYFGGRRIDTLYDSMVLAKLAASIRQMANAKLVRIVMDGSDTTLVPITDDTEIDELLKRRRRVLIDRVSERLSLISMVEDGALTGLSDERLSRLDALLAEAGIMTGV